MSAGGRRLLVLNNYSLERVRGEVDRGEKPAHHLFGIDHLEGSGWEVQVAPLNENWRAAGVWGRIARLIRRLFDYGDIAQQRAAWKIRAGMDAVYAPCQTQTGLLALARSFGLTTPPLAVVAHHPIIGGRLGPLRRFFERLAWKGVDIPLALSSRVASEISALRGGLAGASVIHWGPDLDFYRKYQTPPQTGIVASGRTGRDFAILAEAASGAAIKLSIFCLESERAVLEKSWGSHVMITSFADERDGGYKRILPHLSASAIHAIPLVSGNVLSGLTSLCDAVALGRAVFMTRNSYIDVDIEGEGFGRWIEPGDLDGWREAIVWAQHHQQEVVRMGARACAFAEKRMNYRRFCSDLEGFLLAAVGEISRRRF